MCSRSRFPNKVSHPKIAKSCQKHAFQCKLLQTTHRYKMGKPVIETTPLLKGVRSDILLDASSDLPGFVASELEQDELIHDPTYTRAHQAEQADNSSSYSIEFLSPKRTNIILLSMYVGVFLASLDATIVTTLSGRIASEFHALPKLPWIATAYLVSSASFQPLYGKLSDIFGRRAVLLFCNVSFGLGCLICSMSQGIDLLIAGRFISGAGAGGLLALTSICCSDLIPLRQRGLYQGVTNVAFGLGTATGGFVGGLFADNESLGGWRGAFMVQVPLTLVSGLLIHTFLILPRGSPGLGVNGDDITLKLKLIDWFGSVSLIVSLLLFLTGASIGGEPGFEFDSSNFIGLFIATVISLATFITVELKVKNPTLPLRFLTIPTVAGVSISNFFTSISTFSITFIVPIYLRIVFDLNSTEIGKRFSPNFFSIVIGSLGSGYYMRQTGRYKTLLCIAGLFMIYGQYRVVNLSPQYTTLEQYLIFPVPGIGASVVITVTLLALIAAVPHEHQASTTSISYLFRSCGSTLGVSIGAEIFNKSLKRYLNIKVLEFVDKGYEINELKQIISSAIHSSEYVNSGAPEFVKQTLVDCYASAAKNSFIFALVSSTFAFGGTLLIKEYTLHSSIKR